MLRIVSYLFGDKCKSFMKHRWDRLLPAGICLAQTGLAQQKSGPAALGVPTLRGRCMVLWSLWGDQPLPAQPNSSIFSLHLSMMA